MKQTAKQFLICLIIPVVGGILIGFFINGASTYQTLQKPPLSPPSIVFPIVWTILYVLMGISSYLICKTYHRNRKQAIVLYFGQLLLNFLWPILFFVCKNYFLALILLFILIYTVIKMIFLFYQINKRAGVLQLPYLLWLFFASYLNMTIIFLN